jgi:beta-glucosidase
VTLTTSDDIAGAVKMASDADVAVVVVGYDAGEEGEFLLPPARELWRLYPMPAVTEVLSCLWTLLRMKFKIPRQEGGNLNTATSGKGGDRVSLRLRSRDVEIINAVSAINPRTIVTIITAGAVIMEDWRQNPSAILQSWYSDCEGGHALASGRLPYSIPKDEKHLPYFDRNAASMTYDRWFGQQLLDKLGVKAAFPLGFGLSYTSFKLSDASVSCGKADTLDIHVSVCNSGSRTGRFVAQIYGTLVPAVENFPTRLLLGFAAVELGAGESKFMSMEVSILPLKQYKGSKFVLGSAKAEIRIGAYARDPDSLVSTVDLK